jgi:hypothetical protein
MCNHRCTHRNTCTCTYLELSSPVLLNYITAGWQICIDQHKEAMVGDNTAALAVQMCSILCSASAAAAAAAAACPWSIMTQRP